MPTGVYTLLDLNSERGSTTPRQKKTRRFEKKPCPIFNGHNQNLNLKVSLPQVDGRNRLLYC